MFFLFKKKKNHLILENKGVKVILKKINSCANTLSLFFNLLPFASEFRHGWIVGYLFFSNVPRLALTKVL